MVILLVLPVVFINHQHTVDWGGDYAMYITEAMNIAHHQPVDSTHYVYNSNAPMLGPPLYPVGFPLLLAPVYLIFGNNILAMIVYMSLMLILLTLVLQLFFRRYFSETVSIILVLVILYNPWILHFKNEILADIPFALFFNLTLILYLYRSKAVFTGLAMGFSILIKTAGFALPVAFILYLFYQLITGHEDRKIITKRLLIPVIYSLLLVLFVNKILFHLPWGIGLYSENFSLFAFKQHVLKNTALYIELFQSFFHRNLYDWKFLVLITQPVLFTFALIGFLNSKKDLLFFVVSTYLLMLIVYPYHFSGFRFLLPVIPVLLYYSLNGFNSIRWRFSVQKKLLIPLLAVFLLGQYIPEIIRLATNPVTTKQGPQEQTSQEVFEYIRNNLSEDETILFTKPRVLALYTGRKSVCNELNDDLEKMDLLLRDKRVGYILTNENLSNPALEKYLISKKDHILLIWSNKKFKLYQVNDQRHKISTVFPRNIHNRIFAKTKSNDLIF
ncbi:MAG: hypothetical protein GXO86_15525 [Chlorobi bacterium]|nr:hypothetical protein [Chlorobiota bacterium]